MKNYGKKVMCLIFVTVVVLWTGFTLPRWLRDVPTGQVEIGKSGAEREPDEFMDMGVGKAQEYEQQVYGSVRQVLERRSVDGFSGEAQTVLEKVYDTLDEIITPGMTDQDKVRAIHDYLILHADYYEGDLGTRPGWSSAAEGVLMRGSGVCNSYALAFYAMCTAESVECHIVSGWATSTMGRGDHAWNRVKLGDTWYYIDCTWDDPTGGGMENYEYYLSTALWTDHEDETEYDPGEESFGYWREYYLTGEQW